MRYVRVLLLGLLVLLVPGGGAPALAASYTVDSTVDAVDATPGNAVCATSGGLCTLRAAIQEANALGGPDVINVPAGTYTLTIAGAGEEFAATGDLDIRNDPLEIRGAGAGTTIIDQGPADVVFDVFVTATISGVTIQGGSLGIANESGATVTLDSSTVSGNSGFVLGGGGIYNLGTVTLNSSTVSGNTATSGGGIFNKAGATVTLNGSTVSGNTANVTGGGIFNAASAAAMLNYSTVSANSTNTSTGGGIRNSGTLTLNNSAVSDNTSPAAGGGILSGNATTLTLNSSNVSGNSSGTDGGGIRNFGLATLNNSTVSDNNAGLGGGGVSNASAGTMTLKNTIVASSPSGGNCSGAIVSSGYNLSSDATCGFSRPGDLTSTDPLLGPLADNGGPTFTHALLPGSPAIDAASPDCPPPDADQRGITRPQILRCDIGAYELQVIEEGVRPDEMADLAGTSLTPLPVYPVPGELVDVALEVRNGADHAAQNVGIVLLEDNTAAASTSIDIEPGRSETVHLPWTAQSGFHTLTAVVNGQRGLLEEDLSDNVIEVDVPVALQPSSEADFAVLGLDVVSLPQRRAVVRTLVRNNGTVAAQAPLVLKAADQMLAVRLVGPLNPGQSVTVEVPWPKEAAPAQFFAEVNPRFRDKENVPIDNSLERDTRPPVDLRVEGLSVQAAKFDPNRPRQVTISFRVTNIGILPVTQLFRTSVFPGQVGLDGSLQRSFVDTPGLAAGAAVYASRTIIAPVSEFDIRIDVDVDHQIAEADEANNVATSHFHNPAPDVDRWVSIGPRRIESGLGAVGLITAIAIHPMGPDVIYVGAKRGSGVWKTTDGGDSWEPVAGSLPTLSIFGLAIDPPPLAEPDLGTAVYVATPDGIFRSDDGGTSWLRVSGPDLNIFKRARLLVHPGNRIYVVSTNGVYRSAEFFRPGFPSEWELSLATSSTVSDLVMHPSSASILYAAIDSDGIYKTVTGGDSWSKLSGGLPVSGFGRITLALMRDVPNTLYAFLGTADGDQLYRTDNAGASWQLISTSPSLECNEYLGVDPADPAFVYVGDCGDDFYRSIDGGESFIPESAPHVDHHAFAIDPLVPNVIYTGSDGGIYRSLNRGDTWSFISEGIENVEFYDIANSATNSSLVIGGTQDNGTVKYSGTTTVWDGILGGDGATVDIDPTNDDTLYYMNQRIGNSLRMSTDGGASEEYITRGLPTLQECSGSRQFNAHFQVHPSEPSILLASACSLWRTTRTSETATGVDTWSAIWTPSDNVVRSAVDATIDLYYASSNQGNLYAGPSGAAWQTVFTHPAGKGSTDVDVDLKDPETVYASFGGGGTNRVYKLQRSSPTPTTMAAVDITSDLPTGLTVRALAVDDLAPFTVYAGTTEGVYRGCSVDGGTTWSWTPYNNGLPLADIRDLEVHPGTGVMRAGTFGRSAFEVITPGNDDPDADGLVDWEESCWGTERSNPDSDGDGLSDGYEVSIGWDPLDRAFPPDRFDDEVEEDVDKLLCTGDPPFEICLPVGKFIDELPLEGQPPGPSPRNDQFANSPVLRFGDWRPGWGLCFESALGSYCDRGGGSAGINIPDLNFDQPSLFVPPDRDFLKIKLPDPADVPWTFGGECPSPGDFDTLFGAGDAPDHLGFLNVTLDGFLFESFTVAVLDSSGTTIIDNDSATPAPPVDTSRVANGNPIVMEMIPGGVLIECPRTSVLFPGGESVFPGGEIILALKDPLGRQNLYNLRATYNEPRDHDNDINRGFLDELLVPCWRLGPPIDFGRLGQRGAGTGSIPPINDIPNPEIDPEVFGLGCPPAVEPLPMPGPDPEPWISPAPVNIPGDAIVRLDICVLPPAGQRDYNFMAAQLWDAPTRQPLRMSQSVSGPGDCSAPRLGGQGGSFQSVSLQAADQGEAQWQSLELNGLEAGVYALLVDRTHYGGLFFLHFFVDSDRDGVPDPSDNCPQFANADQADNDGDRVGNPCDNCPSTPNADQANTDGDRWGDACEIPECVSVATAWVTPPGDGDCDGFTSADEGLIGTNASNGCGAEWPANLNNTASSSINKIDIFDVNALAPPVFFSSPPNPNYTARKDIGRSPPSTNGKIDIFDVNRMAPPVFFATCTP